MRACFSLLADSYGSYPASMLLTPSYPNAPLSHTSSRAFSSNKQTTPLGPRGRSTSAPNVSFVNLDRGTTEEVCHATRKNVHNMPNIQGFICPHCSSSDLVCADILYLYSFQLVLPQCLGIFSWATVYAPMI